MSTTRYSITCPRFQAEFNERGALVSLTGARGGKRVLHHRGPGVPSPFRMLRRPIRSKSGGKEYALDEFEMRVLESSSSRFVVEGISRDGGLAVVQIARPSPDGALEWSLQVTNRRGAPLWRIDFPILSGLDCGRGQRVTIPHNAGFSLDPQELEEDEEVFLNYPVHASMQWIDLYTRSLGLYVGVHDPLPYLKQFAVGRSGSLARMEWRYPDVLLRAGESWPVPAATIDLHRGDWHAGANRYRRWAESCMSFPSPPGWFSRLPAWSWLTGKGNHAPRPRRMFRDLPEVSGLLRRETGVPVVQLAGWMEHGHDTHYPDYRAGGSMGGRKALREAVERIHSEGGRLSLYTNGRLIDPEGSVGSMEGWQEFCVRLAPCSRENAGYFTGTFTGRNRWDPVGDIARERYGKTLFAVGCPHDAGWRDLFIGRMLHVVRTYPVDGIYIDQVCGATSLPCYAESHGHGRPNLAWRGYVDFLAALRAEVRSVRPEMYLATEGVSDVFGGFFDAQQAHNDWTAQIRGKGKDMCDLFRYTFPESLVLVGPTGAGREEYLRLGIAVAGGFDCFPVFPQHSTASFRGFMRDTLALRRRIDRYVRGAKPLAGVSASSRSVKVFGLEGRRHVLITGAWLREGGRGVSTVWFTPLGESRFDSGFLFGAETKPLEWEEEAGGRIAFRVSGTNTFAALFRR